MAGYDRCAASICSAMDAARGDEATQGPPVGRIDVGVTAAVEVANVHDVGVAEEHGGIARGVCRSEIPNLD